MTEVNGVLERVEFAALSLHETVLDLDVLAALQAIGQSSDELRFIV